ncbi:hypothetical protein PY365_25310 [Roseiarcaceae bacterium H3SJ34-1]|uniref:hypothetical protein n=1 Tax=Terripilifer ovatus TaxID=3032367 RepID=UPI003AB91B81|nr:hypothetical protein [Roseiarcaceae bacterium H3SJ34-1]
MRNLPLLLTLCAVPSLAAAPGLPTKLSCDGVFAKDSSHARLVKVFGATNVRHTKVPDPYDEVPVSVVYPKDNNRKLQFHWADEKGRKILSEARVYGAKSPLKTPGGIGVGTPLAQVVALNGRPVMIQGFGTEVQGAVNFDGGALEKLPGGCRFGLYVVPGPGAPVPPDAISGEGSFSSDDPHMRAQNFVVGWMIVNWSE